jgi:hypothetical protein
MAFGPGVTGGVGAKVAGGGFNYGPSQAGGQLGFAQNWARHYQNQAAMPGATPQTMAAAQGWTNQLGQLQRQQNAQRQAQRPAATTPLANPPPAAPVTQQPAQQPAAQQQPAAAPPTNPLLAALQGSPYSQGQTKTTANAISQAIGGIGAAGPGQDNQDAFLKRLRQMITQGSL